MKKLILGCALMLLGAICGTGWVIAQAVRVEPGAWSTMLNMFPGVGLGRPDGYSMALPLLVQLSLSNL